MAPRTASPRQSAFKRLLQRSGVSLLLLLLLVLAGGLMAGFVRRAWQEHQINLAIDRQQAQNAEQSERNAYLKGAAEFAESDVAAELAARERLGMAREGDMVLLPTVVLPPTPTALPPALQAGASTPIEEAAEPNVKRWFRALFPGPDAVP